jgi:hypothetical protein
MGRITGALFSDEAPRLSAASPLPRMQNPAASANYETSARVSIKLASANQEIRKNLAVALEFPEKDMVTCWLEPQDPFKTTTMFTSLFHQHAAKTCSI